MTKDRPYVGVVSTGIYIPEHWHTAEYIAKETGIPQDVIEQKFGFYKKPVPGPDDHTAEMGVRAGRMAIERAGIDPGEIDLVIYIGEEYKEMHLWTAGIYSAHALGAENAWAFDCQLRCGTWSLGMKLAEAMAVSDDNINTIMLVGGYRNGDYIDYKNKRVSFMYDLGAAGAAMILKKNYGRNRVVGSSFVTDGSLSGVVGVKGGGTKAGLRNFDPELYYLDVFDRDFMNQRLGEVSLPNFIKVIQDVCAMAGKETKDIGYLAMLHFKRSAHIALLDQLGVPQERCIYLEEYGHMGQMDQIISIHLALERGLIRDGDLVVGASAGVGWAWGATAIQWGPVE